MRSAFAGLAALGLLAVSGAVAHASEPKPTAGDGRVPAGEYVEIDPEGKANRNFLLMVQVISPNIIHLHGKNGWVAFASYDAEKKEYRGFFEWPDIPGLGRPGGKWADLYQVRVVMKDGILRIEGKSAANELLIRARSSGQAPAPMPQRPVRPADRQ